jgi:hypothetical protein
MQGQMTITQVAEYLGVSRTKVWKLINEGALSARTNPLDKRERVVPRVQVERLKSADPSGEPTRPIGRFASDGIASNPNAPHSDELEEYLRKHWGH